MRTAVSLLIGSFVLLFGHPSVAAPPETEVSAVVRAGNHFAVDLYGQLNKEQPGQNLFFSPISLSIALSMTAAGARGRTEAEMAQVLHLTGILPQAHAEYHRLLDRWNANDKDRGYHLHVANRLWGQKGYPFLAGYLDLVRKEYGAELGIVDFAREGEAARQEINAWVEAQTAKKIKELIPQNVLNDQTRLVLANAIYFKGNWANRFHDLLTQDEYFAVSAMQKVKVRMMQQRERTYRYAEDALQQVIELPYKGDDLSMLVLLPKNADGLRDLEESLSAEKIANLRASLRAEEVQLYLPKFKLGTSFLLKPTLEALGMKSAFSAAADFSGTDGQQNLYISAVLHKAMVEVNEEGTEAAAASAVDRQLSVPSGPVFRANHPFVFMVCDRRDGSVLFMGRIANPSQ